MNKDIYKDCSSLLKNEAQDGYIVVTRMIDETKIVKKKNKKNPKTIQFDNSGKHPTIVISF